MALQRGEYENAIGVLEELVQSSSAVDGASRVRALAYLVVALSYVDASRAEVKSMSLPSVDESTVDAAQLELDAPRVSKTSVSKFADRIADVEEQRKSYVFLFTHVVIHISPIAENVSHAILIASLANVFDARNRI